MNEKGRKPVKFCLHSLAERKVQCTFMYCIIVLYAKENTAVGEENPGDQVSNMIVDAD